MKIYFLTTDGVTRITDIYEDEIDYVEWKGPGEGSFITKKYEAELPFSEAGISWAANPDIIRPEQKRLMKEAGWHTIKIKGDNK